MIVFLYGFKPEEENYIERVICAMEIGFEKIKSKLLFLKIFSKRDIIVVYSSGRIGRRIHIKMEDVIGFPSEALRIKEAWIKAIKDEFPNTHISCSIDSTASF